MSESKELLEATVKGLQEKIQSLQTELNVKTLELNNINKPKLLKSVKETNDKIRKNRDWEKMIGRAVNK